MGDVAHRLTETEVVAFVLLDLALIVALARTVGRVFVKLDQPRVIGEIVAGLLLGPTVLGGSVATAPEDPGSGIIAELFPLQAFEFLNLMATVALVLFMFLVGLEVEQRFFHGRGRQIVVLGLAVTVVPFAIGFGVAAILDEPDVWRVLTTRDGEDVPFVTHALFIGAGLAVTAFPVMARILEERHMLSTEMGAVAIDAAAVSLPLMFIMIASAFATGPHGSPSRHSSSCSSRSRLRFSFSSSSARRFAGCLTAATARARSSAPRCSRFCLSARFSPARRPIESAFRR